MESGLPSWEKRAELGFWKAGGITLRQVLFHPTAAFSGLRHDAPLKDALLFFAVFGGGGALAGAVWGLLPTPGLPPLPPSVPPDLRKALADLQSFCESFGGLRGLLLAPLMAFAGMLAMALMAHLGLMVTASRRQDLSATLALHAYALGAAGVLQALPGGDLFFLTWGTACLLYGMRPVHACKPWQAAFAVLWWHLFCWCGIGVAFVLLLRRLLAGM